MSGIWVLSLLLNLAWVWSAPVIDAPWGRISGKDSTSPGGAPFSAYLGIPYAAAPVGDLRFAKPVARQGPGVGRVFNASSSGYICPQADLNFIDIMSEDCLTLSVYVPATVSGPRSVIIWIHGGGFTEGSALGYTPSELVTENDVIVVVIQYRLDVLGFLSSGDGVVSGNYGLMDQNMAIHWVKDNIQAFGGDPNSMTLFGESAGAASVGLQMLTPMSKDLNFKVILQSGSPLASWSLNKNPSEAFYNLANFTGCLYTTSWSDSVYSWMSGDQQRAENERILACLRRKDPRDLIRDMQITSDGQPASSLPWIPNVDGEFLPRAPEDLSRDADYLSSIGATSRDVLIGLNNDEGGFFLELFQYLANRFTEGELNQLENYLQGSDALKQRSIKDELVKRYGEDLLKQPQRLKTLITVLNFFYSNGKSELQDTSDLVSDISFTVPIVRFIRSLAAASEKASGGVPAGRRFLYLFNHYPARKATEELKGMFHAEDIVYVFDPVPPFFTRDEFNADDFNVASTLRSILTNFAKSGTPQLTLVNQADSVWPEFTLAEEKYLSLEVVPRVETKLYNKRVALWVDLLPSLVNSTRPQSTSTWQWPWQQQQQQQCNWQYNTYGCNSPVMGQAPIYFTFNGFIKFTKK